VDVFLTIAELDRAYDRKELSPVEVTRALLDRVAAHDGKLHSFIRVTPEVALAEAKTAEAELMAGKRRGPMHGGSRTSSRRPASRPPVIQGCASITCLRRMLRSLGG
jgi:hypothetical protein